MCCVVLVLFFGVGDACCVVGFIGFTSLVLVMCFILCLCLCVCVCVCVFVQGTILRQS